MCCSLHPTERLPLAPHEKKKKKKKKKYTGPHYQRVSPLDPYKFADRSVAVSLRGTTSTTARGATTAANNKQSPLSLPLSLSLSLSLSSSFSLSLSLSLWVSNVLTARIYKYITHKDKRVDIKYLQIYALKYK